MNGALARMGEAVPLGYKGTIAAGLATGALFVPVYGLVPATFTTLALAYGASDTPAKVLSDIVGLGLAPFLLGRFAEIRASRPQVKKNKYRGINIGPVKATERDLNTSMLILGATGSGKTSRVLYPVLEDLVNTYSDEDPDVFSKNPYQKMGGFVLEVKGKFFETLVCLVHRSGRNAATDVRVIRANSTLPVVEFLDEHGRRFFLNGQPSSTGSEVSLLYKPHKFKDGVAIESTLFKRPPQGGQPKLVKREPELKTIEVRVHEDVRFIGWRWKDGMLHRVRQTQKRDSPEYTGEVIAPPKRLKYYQTLYLSNRLNYNLIDPHIPASEAAERIAMVAKMVTGEGKGGGDNQFFYTAASRAIQSAILLHRIINPKTETTVLDVNRIIAHDSTMSSALKRLGEYKNAEIARKETALKEGRTDTANEIAKTIASYDDLAKWFTEEWMKLKAQGNTGTSIMSTISNLFGPFMNDPNLRETFCQPATFSFNDCLQKGTIFAFVPGPEYEMNARLIGTVLKMDWQSKMLQRVSEGSDALNKNRQILGLADECQKFIISGSQEAGDPNFMSLCRESRVINICATQSEAWVYSAISRNEARVWTQSFGTRVWLTQTDGETNEQASKMCGMIKKEDRSHTEEFDVAHLATGKQQSAKQKIGYKEKPRFETHEFTQLKEDEAICFNKGEGMLSAHMGDCKAMKGKIPWRWITADSGLAEIADRMRWWFCETWENDLFLQGRESLLDPVPGKNAAADGEAGAAAPVASPPAEAAGTPPRGGGPDQTMRSSTVGEKTEAELAAEVLRLANSMSLNEGTLSGGAKGAGPGPKPASDPVTPQDPAAERADEDLLEEAAASPVVGPEAPLAPSPAITPAEIARQETAYQELLEKNPFLMVAYEDFAGLDRSRAGAKQNAGIPLEDLAVVGRSGVVGGNEGLVKEMGFAEGSKENMFRVPADQLQGDPQLELAKRTISALSGKAPAPEAVKLAASGVRDNWAKF